MSPTDFNLPESLMPGNGAVRPTLRTSTYGGGSQTQTPTSPADRSVPFDSPHSKTGGRSESANTGMDGSPGVDPHNIRRLETNLPTSRDQSTPRDRPDYWDRPTPRDRPRQNGRPNKSPGSSHRVCKKCNEPLTGQFVRALGATFHLECFMCEVGASPLICHFWR